MSAAIPRRAIVTGATIALAMWAGIAGCAKVASDATSAEQTTEAKLRQEVKRERSRSAKLRKVAAKERRAKRAARRTYKRLRRDLRSIGLYVSPRESAWLCIHSHEGAWNADTGNGYFGGLQMDRDFQRTYGPEFMARWGTANNWPVWAQIMAADRAHKVRGFQPWPNTARFCGLL